MEVAGLVFGVLSALELCLTSTSKIETLVRQYKTVESDFGWVSQRLRLFKSCFDVWVQFWNIERDTPQKTFYVLWGQSGTITVQTYLNAIKDMCDKAQRSQAQYKRDFEAPSSFTKYYGKFRFSFSGKKELEGQLGCLRVEFDSMRREAQQFFMEENPGLSISTTTKDRIHGIVRDSGMMDQAISAQQKSKGLFYGLRVAQLDLSLDLVLQPDYVSKRQFQGFQFDARKLHEESVKLPVVVSNAFAKEKSKIVLPSVFVIEAGEKKHFEAALKERNGSNERNPSKLLQTKDLNTIVALKANLPAIGENDIDSDESFILQCPRDRRCGTYRFLVHSTGPYVSRSNSLSLEKLFDTTPQHIRQSPSRRLSIAWKSDLAYTLALSVLNLQGSGWLDKLQSRNIYRHDTHSKSALQHSIKVCGHDVLDPKESALEIFLLSTRNSSHISPEIFRLGVIMLEIGLARSVSSTLGEDPINKSTLEHLCSELEITLGSRYAEATRKCLFGEFELDYSLSTSSFIKSYISSVLEPLRAQCEVVGGGRTSRLGDSRRLSWQ